MFIPFFPELKYQDSISRLYIYVVIGVQIRWLLFATYVYHMYKIFISILSNGTKIQ
jgi:hypothetical protein